MRRFTHRLLGEFAPLFALHAREGVVFQKARVGERVDRWCAISSVSRSAGDPRQCGAQIQLGVLAVEAFQAFHQRRRNNQHGVGVAVGIANEQAGIFGAKARA